MFFCFQFQFEWAKKAASSIAKWDQPKSANINPSTTLRNGRITPPTHPPPRRVCILILRLSKIEKSGQIYPNRRFRALDPDLTSRMKMTRRLGLFRRLNVPFRTERHPIDQFDQNREKWDSIERRSIHSHGDWVLWRICCHGSCDGADSCTIRR